MEDAMREPTVHEPFLSHDKEELPDVVDRSFSDAAPSSWTLRAKTFSLVNVVILILNISILCFFAWQNFSQTLTCADVPPSPANHIVAYQLRTYDESEVNAFAGTPRPELEDAWDDLMRGEVFRASEEDLMLARGRLEPHVKLEHGGYLAGLSVYHQLHCIEWIKRNYARVQTMEELHQKEDHLDHCLQIIRNAAMCHPDTTLEIFHWEDESSVPAPLQGSDHLCVDFTNVDAWIRQRTLKPNEGSFGPDGNLRPAHNKYRFEMEGVAE